VVRLPLRAVQSFPEPLETEVTTRRVALKFTDAPQLDGLRVLVVDDEPDARELLALVLTEAGAHVMAVGSAEEALAVARAEPLDVLVSDVGLPREDGYSLIQKIRALEGAIAQVPAAALTGFARAEDGHKALACGFQLHVPKPVEPGLLVSLVAKLAGRVDHSPRAAVG
jgi:CheY-like chemotaxis protein